MLELAKKVIELSGSRSRIVHRALPQDDPRQRRPDISKAQQVLGWTPKIALDEGLGRTLSYFQDMLKNNSIRYKILSDQQF